MSYLVRMARESPHLLKFSQVYIHMIPENWNILAPRCVGRIPEKLCKRYRSYSPGTECY